MTINRPSWFTIILMIAVVVLGIIVYFGACNKKLVFPDTHKADSLSRSYDSMIREKDHSNDSLFKIAVGWHSRYDSAWQAILKGQRIIRVHEDSMRKLISLNEQYKAKNDTLSQLVNCQDIIDQLNTLFDQLDKQKIATDSLHHDSDSTIAAITLENQGLRSELLLLKSDFEGLKTQYSDLVKQDRKTIKKAKFADVIAKVAVIAAAILAVATALKK